MTVPAPRPIPAPEDVWRTYDRMETRLTAPLSQRMLDLAGIVRGMRVLDLATGRGEPAIPAAHRVGPRGSVLGLDVSATMLAMARERATLEGLTNLDLRVVNPELPGALPAAQFAATLIRWGLMYMHDPVAALAGARRAMVAGGVLVAAVLADPERASYFTLPRRVLAKYRPGPPPSEDPAAPGPFFYADPARLQQDLDRADLHVTHVEELVLPVMEAATPAEAVAWARAFGMTRLLNDLPAQAQQAWEQDFSDEAEALRKDGFIHLHATTRIVVASAKR